MGARLVQSLGGGVMAGTPEADGLHEQAHELGPTPLLVGSDHGVGLRLEGLRPRHVEIHPIDGGHLLRDLAPGETRVNGALVDGEIELADQWRLELGPVTLVYRLDGAEPRDGGGRQGGEGSGPANQA